MNKTFITLLCAAATMTATADEITLFDFEDFNLGDVVAMRDYYSEDGTTKSKAEITSDPSGKAGKVLHVKNSCRADITRHHGRGNLGIRSDYV